MTLRKEWPDFFRLAKDLRAMRFNFDAPPPKKKMHVEKVFKPNGDWIITKVYTKDTKGRQVYEEAPEQVLADDVPIEEANLLTSRHRYGRARSGGKGMHRPVLDIDFDAALIPSSTPGHFHLILDKAMPWDTYEKLLDALAEAGIIQQGYAAASKAKGYTAVRPPWVRKEKAERRIISGLKTLKQIQAEISSKDPFMSATYEPDTAGGYKWKTQTPSQKQGTSSKTDGAKEPSTKTQKEAPSTPSTPAAKQAASSEPSTW